MRLDYSEVTPEIGYTMAGLQRIVAAAHLEPELLERVKQRASQINGRAYAWISRSCQAC